MMRKLAITMLAIAGYVAVVSAITQAQVGPSNPGLLLNGAFTVGNCMKIQARNQVIDNGGICRKVFTADTVFTANASTGVDNNTCGPSTACLTAQRAYDNARQFYDQGGFKLTITLVGTFTPGSGNTLLSMSGPMPGVAAQGTQGTRLAVDYSAATINIAGAANAFACDQGCNARMNGNNTGIINIGAGGSGNTGNALISDNISFAQLLNGTVNGTTGNCVGQSNTGSVTVLQGITITGSWVSGGCSNQGFLNMNGTITNTGTPTYSGSFIAIRGGAKSAVDGVTFTGAITGQQWSVIGNSVLSANGATVPGTAGSTATGGQACTSGC